MLFLLLSLLVGGLESKDRVVFLSLDGFGYQRWLEGDVVQQTPSLAKIARSGVHAEGIVPHFPSTTANSHAALFTGVYGDRNGIVANENPPFPRAGRQFTERVSGFRSESLKVEPIWAVAARRGLSTVAHQVTQAFPFQGPTIAQGEARELVLVNGYQTTRYAQDAVITSREVEDDDHPRPAGIPAGRQVRFRAGPVMFHMVLTTRDAYVWVDGAPFVRVPLRATETTPPQGRTLARHFSSSLYIPALRAGVFFRLFENQQGQFLLYHTALRELGVYGPESTAAEMLRSCGGFVGNAANFLYERGRFGPLGSGLAERRYLETVELNGRQSACHAVWLWKRFKPVLFVDYFNQPDDLDHALLGMDRAGKRDMNVWRAWGYQVVEHRLKAVLELFDSDDHIFIASDHGMTSTSKRLHVDAVLRKAGLADRVSCLTSGLLLNTVDWKDGLIVEDQKASVLAAARKALSEVSDGGKRVVTEFFDPAVFGERFGIHGPNSADLYFDVAPGYYPVCGPGTEEITEDPHPRGSHGMMPERIDMLGIFFARGPTLPSGKTLPRMRSIEVLPLVKGALGLN
ncbi:MAG: alkaline phosphatase family protein [Bryobacteraceae bacterium]|nr:alkaline phosphatase family protein [Bryobacteraceae bacterium]MDW8378642.1 alkaline phosphatase family protein [Bryobacterales bacterium]